MVVGGAVNSSELLVDRDRVGGDDAAYVCRGRVCDLPVTTAEELAAALGAPRVAFGHVDARRHRRDRQALPRARRAKGKADDIVDLYAEDATVEDPVGGEVHIGRQAIHGFYEMIPEGERREPSWSRCGPRPRGGVLLALTVEVGGNRLRIEIISTMTFNDDGKIASMKAYWGPEDIRACRGALAAARRLKTANHIAM